MSVYITVHMVQISGSTVYSVAAAVLLGYDDGHQNDDPSLNSSDTNRARVAPLRAQKEETFRCPTRMSCGAQIRICLLNLNVSSSSASMQNEELWCSQSQRLEQPSS